MQKHMDASKQAALQKARASAARCKKALTPSLQKLTAGYRMKCYWFEVFE